MKHGLIAGIMALFASALTLHAEEQPPRLFAATKIGRCGLFSVVIVWLSLVLCLWLGLRSDAVASGETEGAVVAARVAACVEV